jgi:hypothetical protein
LRGRAGSDRGRTCSHVISWPVTVGGGGGSTVERRSEERNSLFVKGSRPDSLVRLEPASFLLGKGDRRTTRPLTLRITPVPSDDPGILRLEGRLRAEEVPVLEKSAEAGVRALDLEDLMSADEEGLAAIRRLRDRGVEIKNPSHYLAMLLA